MYRQVTKFRNAISTILNEKKSFTSLRNLSSNAEDDKYKIKDNFEGRPLYLDVQATSPTDPRVLDAMLPYLTHYYGNPHSRTHAYGWESEAAVEKAREYVADIIGADPREIIFTSGATESNNIAIKGVARFYKEKKKHIITTQTVLSNKDQKPVSDTKILHIRLLGSPNYILSNEQSDLCFGSDHHWNIPFIYVGTLPSKTSTEYLLTEHKCVLDSCRALEGEGFTVTYLPVKTNGIICLEELEKAITPETAIVSIMSVNNEIGVKQPIDAIGVLCKQKKVFFHTDAAQAVGKIHLDVNSMNIDLMSISGHKIYGPKGIGAIYIRRRPRVRVEAIQSGGGQERGIRSGTVPAPLAVGFGEACRLAKQEMAYDHAHVEKLSKRLIDRLCGSLTHVIRNGDDVETYPGCVNLSFAYVEGESLLMALKDIALSSGSACTSASLEPSYVLRAIGADEDLAHSSIRFGIGRFTTEAEVDYTAKKCIHHVTRLREMSPLWEMVQEGVDLKTIKWSQH